MLNENIAIGLRIRNLREKQSLSRERFAEIAGISTQFVADIETGKKGMTIATLQKICSALNVTADYIVYGENPSISNDLLALLSTLDSDKQEQLYVIIQKILNLK